MTFVSYAQNYEDVMLMRALRGIDAGFYIDVGAQHPRHDSVTKAFYDLGWHGINVEPVEHWHRMLVEARPRDINLCLAAGADEGEIDLFEVPDSGLSTTSEEFARRHRESGLPVQPPRRVPVRRLDAICAELGVSQVHFLKVDAEGAEADVLRGLDLQEIRPWIVLVEATEPNSRVSSHGDWEALLTGRGYQCIYEDGLNRFYLAQEHAALAPAFSVPPNTFDAFVRRDQVDEADRLLQLLRESDALLTDRAAHIAELATRIGNRDAEIARLLEAHRRDAATLLAQAGLLAAREQHIGELSTRIGERDIEIVRLVQAHHRDLDSMQAQEAMIAALRARQVGLERSIEQLEHIGARLSNELMSAQAGQLAAEAGLQASHATRAAAEAETAHVRLALQHERTELARVLASRSWRLTAPLRAAVSLASTGLRFLESVARGLARLGPIRALVAALVSPFPNFARSVKLRLYGVPVEVQAAEEVPGSATPAPIPLSEDAEEILARLPVPAIRGADS